MHVLGASAWLASPVHAGLPHAGSSAAWHAAPPSLHAWTGTAHVPWAFCMGTDTAHVPLASCSPGMK
eukprot:353651-Chlamydomonas_euryale.AAC.6